MGEGIIRNDPKKANVPDNFVSLIDCFLEPQTHVVNRRRGKSEILLRILNFPPESQIALQ